MTRSAGSSNEKSLRTYNCLSQNGRHICPSSRLYMVLCLNTFYVSIHLCLSTFCVSIHMCTYTNTICCFVTCIYVHSQPTPPTYGDHPEWAKLFIPQVHLFPAIGAHMRAYVHICAHMRPYVHICAHMELYRAPWSPIGAYRVL